MTRALLSLFLLWLLRKVMPEVQPVPVVLPPPPVSAETHASLELLQRHALLAHLMRTDILLGHALGSRDAASDRYGSIGKVPDWTVLN